MRQARGEDEHAVLTTLTTHDPRARSAAAVVSLVEYVKVPFLASSAVMGAFT